MDRPRIEACTEAELGLLRDIATRTYVDTFGPANAPETMARYLAEAMAEGKLRDELRTPGSSFYLAKVDGRVAGYLKLNVDPAQTDRRDPGSLEVERIYIDRGFKGQGLGKALIDFAEVQALERGKSLLRLGVWERNEAALGFYRALGFRQVGSHPFRMGDEVQTDYVLERAVPGQAKAP